MRLVALTVATSAIRVVGVVETGEPLIMARSARSPAPTEQTLLQQMDQNIFQREMLQAHYVNSRSL